MDDFQVNSDRGFLPSPDPLGRLPGYFKAWDEIGRDLPKLLSAGKIRSRVETLPLLEVSDLRSDGEQRRAMLILSFVGHAFVWGEPDPVQRIPACLAVPWYEVSQLLGRPPVLSYASYALDNWRRLDPNGAIELGNIALLQNFLGGMDEEWFVLVHVAIEAHAAPALGAIVEAQHSVSRDDSPALERQLSIIAARMENIHRILLRMRERCDPYIYYHRVRPYLHGWAHHPALPQGLVYEGVEAFAGRPQKFRGETGAQSSLIPALDAALAISHGEDFLRAYLREMRDYMPRVHRVFIENFERGPSVREYVIGCRSSSVCEAYNHCVEWVERFRTLHLEYARDYIQKQSARGVNNPADVGTGGTPFIPYLTKHRNETKSHRIVLRKLKKV